MRRLWFVKNRNPLRSLTTHPYAGDCLQDVIGILS